MDNPQNIIILSDDILHERVKYYFISDSNILRLEVILENKIRKIMIRIANS